MALSNITPSVQVNAASTLTTILDLNGNAYFVWSAANAGQGFRQLFWRPHGGTDGDEIGGAAVAPFGALSASLRADGTLLVLFDDGITNSNTVNVWSVRFDFATGAVLAAPTLLFEGATPQLMHLLSAPAGHWALTYANKLEGVVYARESYDDGATWTQERPVLNNKTRDTTEITAYPFDDRHVTVAQVGKSARKLVELGSASRTRPLGQVLLKTSGAVYAAEIAQQVVAGSNQVVDNTQGVLFKDPNGLIWVGTRTRLGADDGVGDLAIYGVSGAAPALSTSVVVPASTAANQDDAIAFTPDALTVQTRVNGLVNGNRALTDPLTGLVVTANGVYGAGYIDMGLDDGQASFTTFGGVRTQLTAGPAHCLATASFGGTTVVALAYFDDNAQSEMVRLYVDAPGGPGSFGVATHQMPMRINRLALTMTAADKGTLYVAAVDRLDVYIINGLDQPIQRAGGWSIVSLGQFQDVKVTPNGNLVAALGEGGVAVFAPTGDQLAQVRLSGVTAPVWTPSTTRVVGDLVQPTVASTYAPRRRYFRCTVGGASGKTEPTWNPGPAVTPDGAATWTEVGPLDAVASAVEVDAVLNRIYVAGVIGGRQSTNGRLYILAAQDWRL